ncbi:unnamed protein product [Arctogadus glacialis]
MPFHSVTAGLLYKGNYLSQSLSDTDSDVLASISVEELGVIQPTSELSPPALVDKSPSLPESGGGAELGRRECLP